MASYYNLDDILTDSQKIPCIFELEVPTIGAVISAQSRAQDGTGPGFDAARPRKTEAEGTVGKGAKADLPLWLGYMLAVSPNPATGRGFVTLNFPEALSPHVVNALRAGPKSVDIRALAPNFYALGSRMLDLFEERELALVLSDSFKQRAKEIFDQAYNPKGPLGEGAEFLRGLDDSERKLFRAAHDGSKAVRAWLVSGSKK